jgi:hypothetical protein
MSESNKRELLAAYAHEAWSGWMRHLFSKCQTNIAGDVFIPKWAVERWTRQMTTAYQDLPEMEKESDRAEADKMLAITGDAIAEPAKTELKVAPNEPATQIWPSLHLSTQQRDLADPIELFAGEPGAHIAVGQVYNFDDFPCVDLDHVEDLDETAVRTAEKIVRAYNSHDDLVAVLEQIAAWNFDIAGDCVAEARALAKDVIARLKGAQV